MSQQQIRVHYGLGIVTATLLEEVHDGVLKGWNKLHMTDGHECYMSANSIVTGSNDTDWRNYLKSHWDTTHNYLHPDCAEEFMTIFNRAAAAYMKRKQQPKPETVPPSPPVAKGHVSCDTVAAPPPKKPRYIEQSLFPGF